MIQKCSEWKILKIFLENPTTKFSIRGIGRITGLAPTSVKIHVDRLAKEGMILEKEELVKYLIANFDSPEFRFNKKINNIINIRESGLGRHLDNAASPDAVILFGSYAKGEDTEKSDIDIYVQANEKEIELGEFEKTLGHKIQLFFSDDIKKLPKELANNILNGVKISGYVRVY